MNSKMIGMILFSCGKEFYYQEHIRAWAAHSYALLVLSIGDSDVMEHLQIHVLLLLQFHAGPLFRVQLALQHSFDAQLFSEAIQW